MRRTEWRDEERDKEGEFKRALTEKNSDKFGRENFNGIHILRGRKRVNVEKEGKVLVILIISV